MVTARAGLWQHLARRLRRAAPKAADSQPPESGHDGTAPPAQAQAQTPRSIGGFAIQRTHARGPHGELHLATHPATRVPVALKTVTFHGEERTKERFLQESAAASRLVHPHIVTTYACGIDTTGPKPVGWIAMEWVSGGDLSPHAQADKLLPPALVLQIGIALAEALAHAHRAGVIHRDLKPTNVLFNPGSGLLKLSDFGCAHLNDAERSRSGLIIGTPFYMAPEQLSGIPVDGRCDLYALGMLMFELLTGRLPFAHASLGETLAAIATEPAMPLSLARPELPALLSDVLARLLAKRPADRHANGKALAHELRMLLQPCNALSPILSTSSRAAPAARP